MCIYIYICLCKYMNIYIFYICIYIWGWVMNVLCVGGKKVVRLPRCVGGKIPRGDVVEAEVAPLWLVFFLLEFLADRKTICPKSKLDPLKSHFRFPEVYQVRRDFICCAQACNNINKFCRNAGGEIGLVVSPGL